MAATAPNWAFGVDLRVEGVDVRVEMAPPITGAGRTSSQSPDRQPHFARPLADRSRLAGAPAPGAPWLCWPPAPRLCWRPAPATPDFCWRPAPAAPTGEL